MKCPACSSADTKVNDSRISKEGDVIRRRRECMECHERFTTHERVEQAAPAVIKKDGRREDFNRDKIRRGLDKAFEKRPVSVAEKEALTDRIIRRLRDTSEKEVQVSIIGEAVLEELRQMDEVAYVRFASVYRSFRDVNEFMDELDTLRKDKN